MGRLLASLLALALAVTSSGFGQLCFCHAEDAAAVRPCCPTGKARAAVEAGAAGMRSDCERGCCDASIDFVQVEPPRAAVVQAPARHELPTSMAPATAARLALESTLDATPARAGPLDASGPGAALSSRLATLQVWRC